MPRSKPSPLPDMTAFNLHRRAEQMAAIANLLRNAAARDVLLRKAMGWLELARRAQRERLDKGL